MRLANLSHDTARRFAVILAVLRNLRLPADFRLLDVGGYPGTLARVVEAAFPGASAATVDTIEDPTGSCVLAAGERLPFDDASFDVVVSSDTFEHVPPDRRAPFVREMLRVASGPIVLGAPFAHPDVARIERMLDEAHVALTGRRHAWLSEHVDNGLPDLAATLALLDGRANALVRSAPLLDWSLWQWSWLHAQADGALSPSWDSAERALAAIDESGADAWPASADFELVGAANERKFPCYRWTIVSQPLANAPIAAAPQSDASASDYAAAVAWSEWLGASLRNLAAARSASATTQAVDAQLVAALELAEGELRKARSRNPVKRLFGG